jgi:glycosyltransferase involved in cell wall biosynthesis
VSAPRVSVCVPAYQSQQHLQETLDSVWGQDFEDFELVIVDDGSSDATPEIVAAQTDPRLRAFRHEPNRGQARTVGEAVGRARGEFVKFLDADDLLHRDCLSTMVAALDARPGASFAFCTREIYTENPDDPAMQGWIEVLGDLSGNFDELQAVNDGASLLRQLLAANLLGNWISEPAGVMARRADVLAVGGYNRRLRQNNDLDLWLRLMTRGEVVFIDRALFTYRLEYSGVTGGSEADDDSRWLDGLWTIQNLASMPDLPGPLALRRARRRMQNWALRRAARAFFSSPRRGVALSADLAGYGAYRVATALGRAEPLALPIPERVADH